VLLKNNTITNMVQYVHHHHQHPSMAVPSTLRPSGVVFPSRRWGRRWEGTAAEVLAAAGIHDGREGTQGREGEPWEGGLGSQGGNPQLAQFQRAHMPLRPASPSRRHRTECRSTPTGAGHSCHPLTGGSLCRGREGLRS